MYILNNNKLKNRPVWITWLFYNRRLQKDILESIPILIDDISRLKKAEKKIHEAKMLPLELSVAELIYGMKLLLNTITNIQSGWIPYQMVQHIIEIFKILDKVLKEVEFKKGQSNV